MMFDQTSYLPPAFIGEGSFPSASAVHCTHVTLVTVHTLLSTSEKMKSKANKLFPRDNLNLVLALMVDNEICVENV